MDYNDFSTEDQIYLREVFSFTVRNSNADAAILRFSFELLPPLYNATVINSINLSAGEERTITGNIDVPHAKSSGKTNIGSLVIKDANNIELDRLTLEQNTLTQLIFDRIEVDYIDVDGNHRSDKFESSDTSPKLDHPVRPGSELTFTTTVKNNFDRDYDSDKSVIEDITLEMDPSDSDLFTDEPDDKVDLSDLDANEKDEYTFTTNIDNSIDADTYKIDFIIQGTDGENFDHTEDITITLEVERQRNDIRITKGELDTPIESCDKDILFTLELQNFGTRDQKYTSFALTSTELGINYKANDIELEKFDDSDSYSQSLAIPITKETRVGTYSADLKVYYERDKLIDQERIPFQIIKCGNPTENPANTSVTPTNTGTTNKTTPTATTGATSSDIPNTTTQSTSSQTLIQTIEEPYSTDDFFVGGLIVAIIIVVALIVVFFILLLR